MEGYEQGVEVVRGGTSTLRGGTKGTRWYSPPGTRWYEYEYVSAASAPEGLTFGTRYGTVAITAYCSDYGTSYS